MSKRRNITRTGRERNIKKKEQGRKEKEKGNRKDIRQRTIIREKKSR